MLLGVADHHNEAEFDVAPACYRQYPNELFSISGLAVLIPPINKRIYF